MVGKVLASSEQRRLAALSAREHRVASGSDARVVFSIDGRRDSRGPAEDNHSADVNQAGRRKLAVAERHAGMLRERERLAAELHDTLAQDLSSIVMLLEAAQTSVGKAPRPAAEQVTHALRAARDSLREVRRVVWALRPEALEHGTLVEALDRLADEVSRHDSMKVRVAVTGEPYELATETQVTLLRVAQEGLANARRHAHARAATITLSFMAGGVVLEVRDDGAGFDPASIGLRTHVGHHLGLVAMRERVEALGGTLTIQTAPDEGTTVAAAIPDRTRAHQRGGAMHAAS